MAAVTSSDSSAADRHRREQSFHDARYADDPRASLGKYYRVARASQQRYRDLLAAGPAGDILEYGCGVGSAAATVAPVDARITGIDISPTAIDLARRSAGAAGCENITFEQMNAEALRFDDDSFDLVCGSGILHHLDLDVALGEVARVLRPGGRGVFIEPLGQNPLINLYRRLTPGMRSEDEHPLTRADLADMGARFTSVGIERFHLTAIAAAPIGVERGVGRALLRLAEVVDRAVLALPGVRHLAWIAVIELTDPV
jgi:SAM-dependent methyltransferase